MSKTKGDGRRKSVRTQPPKEPLEIEVVFSGPAELEKPGIAANSTAPAANADSQQPSERLVFRFGSRS